MLGKTLILGLISAGAAGAVVYYGMGPLDSVGSEASASEARIGSARAEKAPVRPTLEQKDSSQKNHISPKLPTVRKVEPKDARQKLAESQWVDLEEMQAEAGLEEDAGEAKTAEQGMDAAPSGSAMNEAPKKQTRWLDQYIKRSSSETESSVNAAAPETDEADFQSEPAESDSATDLMTAEIDEAVDTAEAAGAAQDEEAKSFFRIENGKLVEIEPQETEAADMAEDSHTVDKMQADKKMAHKDAMPPKSKAHQPDMHRSKGHKAEKSENTAHGSATKPQGSATKSQGSSSDYRNKKAEEMGVKKDKKIVMRPRKMQPAEDASPIIATVMQEASLIQKIELRDQAYFEITEYALSEGRFKSARAAHDLIEQDELAYTAKSRIAVAHAHNGQPTKAFKTIGEVEDEELRDFMRLQVIEALIAPQNLPDSWQKQDWQEKQN